MTNPSTIWTQLALPLPAVGSIPFVDVDGVSINIDVSNLFWNSLAKLLSIKTNGDQTGTDALNTYLQQDSYLSVPAQSVGGPAQNALMAGHTVSSSNGTGPLPTSNVTGDWIGHFSGWSYQAQFTYNGVTGQYKMLAGEAVRAVGATVGNLGGELHWFTAADGGALVDRVTLDNLGRYIPTTAGQQVIGVATAASAALGKANQGFSQLNLDYAISGIAGAVTINKPAGSVNIALGAASVVVTNSLVTANSVVLVQLAFNDATLTSIKCVVSAAGSFTITGNANATAQTKVNFLVINTDS